MPATIRCPSARRFAQAALVLTALAGSALAAPPSVRYVRADAPAGGDGLSWGTAYNDLRQSLITAGASGGSITELWVKEGIYLPGPAGSTDRTRSFTLVNDIGVYGGFAGTETEREQRDPAAHVSTLDGFLGGSINVYNVVVGAGNAQTVLDGFTITGGSAREIPSSATHWAGGGMHVTGSPTIRNCVIYRNNCGVAYFDTIPAKMGGGVYCAVGSNAVFIDCVIDSNATQRTDHGHTGHGGGLAAENCSVRLIGCTISNNTTADSAYRSCEAGAPRDNSEVGTGAGMYFSNAAVLMETCTITGNRTGKGGVGVTCGSFSAWPGLQGGNGGGIYSANSALLAVNCIFTSNKTGDGGRGGSGSSPKTGGNGGDGAGLYAVGGAVSIVNSTFAANRPGVGGLGGGGGSPGAAGAGAGVTGDIDTHLENCIIWNDGVSEVVGGLAITYSGVRGGFAGTGNISADPLFVDAASGDYHLQATSPCIDAGNSFPAAAPLPATDLDGNPRRVDLAAVPDTGVGAPVVDMGAYEAQAPCAIDYTGDGQIDFADYLEFLNRYDSLDPSADLNGDGFVDFADYLEFLNLYDAGC